MNRNDVQVDKYHLHRLLLCRDIIYLGIDSTFSNNNPVYSESQDIFQSLLVSWKSFISI